VHQTLSDPGIETLCKPVVERRQQLADGVYAANYINGGAAIGNAGKVSLNGLQQYVIEVGDGTFPGKENYFGIKDEEYNELIRELGE
jgi:hypothetical protein